MTRLVVGTDDGVLDLDGGRSLSGHRVNALSSGGWGVVDGTTVVREADPGTWEDVATLPAGRRTDHRPVVGFDGGVIVGAGDGLVRLTATGADSLPGFAQIDGREHWHAVGSAEPYVRSLTATTDGTLFANVHVGGIPRSRDGGATWTPTIDVDSDVHQVRAHPDRSGVVLAAAAVGLAISEDGGESWTVRTDGLHGSYCRAVAATGDTVLLTASTGPFTDRAAVYRSSISGGSLERVSDWLPHNIDTECLVTAGDDVAFGGPDGRLYVSADAGASWELASDGLPPITSLAYTLR